MREDGTIQPSKVTHFTEQGFKINGIIHVGANDGEELYSYQQQLGVENILCFEPLPLAAEKFRHDHPDVECLPYALSDTDTTMTLYQYGDDGKGSSLGKVNTSAAEVQRVWSSGHMVPKDEVEVPVRRFDSLGIDTSPYDCLVIDVQGHELNVLKGFGDLLSGFKYMNIECSTEPMYEGEASADEVISFLADKGYIQDSPTELHNDIFFIRKDIKPTSDLVYRGLG